VKEIDAIFDAVFDDHPLGIAFDQFGRRGAELIGQQSSRLLMAQIDDGELTQRTVIVFESDRGIQYM
jgi:hypothetical protein